MYVRYILILWSRCNKPEVQVHLHTHTHSQTHVVAFRFVTQFLLKAKFSLAKKRLGIGNNKAHRTLVASLCGLNKVGKEVT